MKKADILRPDEEAILRVLEKTKGTISEVILRLAWQMGMTLAEMHELRWNDVSFVDGQINLSDRSIPMDEDTISCLKNRLQKHSEGKSDYVVITDKRGVRISKTDISTAARKVLKEDIALRNTTLHTLKKDFVIRMLEKYDVTAVSKVSGLSANYLLEKYAPYVKNEDSTISFSYENDDAIWRVIQEEGASPVGLSLWMAVEAGISLHEVVDLTWQQIDMEKKTIHLSNRTVAMDVTLETLLRQLLENRDPDADAHVILSPHKRRPYDLPYLSLIIKQALAQNDMNGLTAKDLIEFNRRKKMAVFVLKLVEERGYITRKNVIEELGFPESKAWYWLNLFVEQEILIRRGGKYYKKDTIVPLEEHEAMILDYMAKVNKAKRQELADYLNTDVRRCGRYLACLVRRGQLILEGKTYRLAR